MTCWIQPTESLAQQLGVPTAPLPVSEATAAAIEAGVVDLSVLARDVDMFLERAEPTDPKAPILSRCAAAIALTAANQRLEDHRHDEAADLFRLAVKHAPGDTGIRASYGSALWLSGLRFDGLAQLTYAVRLNSEQGRIVPMLWILTARAMADAGRHGDALLLLEDLAATGPTDFRFWELIDSLDARSVGIDGGYRPEHADSVLARLEVATTSAEAAPGDALAELLALGTADIVPQDPPLLCLEVSASSSADISTGARPGTLGILDATVGVVRSAESPSAPTPARSTIDIEFNSEAGSASALVAVDGPNDSEQAEALLEAVARIIATMPTYAGQEPFDRDLDAGSSLAMAGLCDLINSASSLGYPHSEFPVSELVDACADRDGDGLRTRIRSLLDVEPSTDAIADGVEELARLGVVRLDTTTVYPELDLGTLTDGFSTGLKWYRFTHHDSHARSLTRRHFVIGNRGILRLGPTGRGGVSWRICQRSDIQRELGVELAIISMHRL